MIIKCKKIITLALVFTIIISSNATLVFAGNSPSNLIKVLETIDTRDNTSDISEVKENTLDVSKIKEKLEAAAIPFDPATIAALLEALINALGLTAALALLRDITSDSSMTVAKAKDRRIVPIYRFGSHTYTNLTPAPKDLTTGLSFTVHVPVTRNKYVVTTLNAVNSTGRLIAVVDNVSTGHVSVRPSLLEPSGTMNNWVSSRDNAETRPHSLTRLLYNLTTPVSK